MASRATRTEASAQNINTAAQSFLLILPASHARATLQQTQPPFNNNIHNVISTELKSIIQELYLFRFTNTKTNIA